MKASYKQSRNILHLLPQKIPIVTRFLSLQGVPDGFTAARKPEQYTELLENLALENR